jgi:short-subunit dehydrogenase
MHRSPLHPLRRTSHVNALAAALKTGKRPLHVAITGASSGIGAALARELSRDGVRLTLVARRRELLDALASELGGPTCCVVRDLADPSCATDWIAEAEARLGPINVLMNNAGAENTGLTATSDPDEGVRLLELNLITPLRLSRALLPSMLAAGSGALVQIASVAALAPTPGHAWYGASKAGLSTFSLALAREVRGTGVRVLTVFPGPVNTPMADAAYAKFGGRRGLVGLLPEGAPEELAWRIVEALVEGREHLIYPRFYSLAWWLPGLVRWLTDRVAPRPTEAAPAPTAPTSEPVRPSSAPPRTAS